MNIRLIIIAMCALFLVPLSASGEEVSYNFLDVAYVNNDMDASATYIDTETGDEYVARVDDGDGFGIRGSWAIHPNWHVFGGYSKTDTGLDLQVTTMDSGDSVDTSPIVENFSLDGDLVDWTFGFGYNHSFTPTMSGYAQLSYDGRDVDFNTIEIFGETENLDVDDEGLGAKVGLRSRVVNWLELNGHVRYSDVGGVDLMADADEDILDSDTLYGFGAEVTVNEYFKLTGEVEFGGDVTTTGLYGRFSFGS